MPTALLPPQASWSLAAIEPSCPRSVPPARDALGRLCAGRSGEGPLPADSALTAARVPLEFTLRGGADEVRYTLDPASLGGAAEGWWRAAAEVLPGIEPAWQHLERLTAPRGARAERWLGARHRGADTDVKLYRRIGAPRADAVRTRLAGAASLSVDPPVEPVLAGADASGAVEVYGRVPGAGRRAVHAALAWGGGGAAFPAIEACVAGLRDRLTSAAWDGVRVGVSWRVAPDGGTVGTVFLHGMELFGDDLVARARLLDLAGRLGQELRGHRELTARLRAAAGPPVHGIVGLTARPDGGVALSVTVAADERLPGREAPAVSAA